MSQLRVDTVSPDVTARAWDDYLRRFGPSAYVAARYVHPTDLPPSRIDHEPERRRRGS